MKNRLLLAVFYILRGLFYIMFMLYALTFGWMLWIVIGEKAYPDFIGSMDEYLDDKVELYKDLTD